MYINMNTALILKQGAHWVPMAVSTTEVPQATI